MKFYYVTVPGPTDGTFVCQRVSEGEVTGTLWYRLYERVWDDIYPKSLEIIYIEVKSEYRKRGYATDLLQRVMLSTGVKEVFTKCGSKLGQPWLLANGFKEDLETSDMVLKL